MNRSHGAETPLIQLDSVGRAYGTGRGRTVALDGVDLQVAPGESLALVGPSGSGKSTLLHLIGAMDSPDRGTVRVAGIDLATLDDAGAARFRRDEVGFVFQFFNLIPTLSALENVALPSRLSGTPASAARSQASRLLDRVGLGDRVDDHPDALSGGQQQRVAIARALVNRPRIVLADEPTGALDRSTGGEILELLANLVREEGVTLLMATHSSKAEAAVTRVIGIVDGRVTSDERSAAR